MYPGASPGVSSRIISRKVWAPTKRGPPTASWRDTLRRVPNFRRDVPCIKVGVGLRDHLIPLKGINGQDARWPRRQDVCATRRAWHKRLYNLERGCDAHSGTN